MPSFNLDDYEPVEDRLAKFWTANPNGRVFTEPVAYSDSQFIFRAAIYRDAADTEPWATGFAEERVTGKGVNSTSALENCETSAIGRALANAGYATKGKRPSREEMAKASRRPAAPATVVDDATLARLSDLIRAVPELDDEALKAAWHKNKDFLEVAVDVDGDTVVLSTALLQRKAELDAARSADAKAVSA